MLRNLHLPLFFISAYCFLSGFQNLIHLPFFEDRIQLTELFFIGMFLYFLYKYKYFLRLLAIIRSDRKLMCFGIAILAYLFIKFISVIFSPSLSGLLEITGAAYLFLLLIIFISFCITYDKETIRTVILKSFYYLGVAMSLIGLIGWIASAMGFPNDTTEIYYNYPYFGDTQRLRAFTTTPSMYISVICLCIIFCLYDFLFYSKKRNAFMVALFCSCVAILTFTKSFLFVMAAWVLLFIYRYVKNKLFIYGIFITIVLLHIVATHFLIIPTGQINNATILKSPFSSNEVIYKGPDFTLVGSGYFQFKKTALQLFLKNPFIGIGPGNYNQRVDQLKKSGSYPQHLPLYDPHSSYFGALAESGIFGLLVLLFLGVAIWNIIQELYVWKDPYSFTLLLIFWIILAEAISMDVMNFRHYWIIFGCIISYYIYAITKTFTEQKAS